MHLAREPLVKPQHLRFQRGKIIADLSQALDQAGGHLTQAAE